MKRLLLILALGLLVLIPVAFFWGLTPFLWVNHTVAPTLEEAEREFPIHFAPLPPSNIRQHLTDIEGEEVTPAVFNPADWALRETRIRLCLLLIIWTTAGIVVNWFASEIIRGKRSLDD